MNVKKLLLPTVLGLACLSSSVYAQTAPDAKAKTAEVVKETRKKTAKKTKAVAEKTAEVSKEAATATVKGTKAVAEKTAEVSKDAAKATVKGTKVAAEKTAEVSKDAAAATVKGTKKAAEVTKDTVTTKKPETKVAGGTANAKEIAGAKASGLVWVNLDSKIYHRDGQHYGTTKNGKFMTEAEAAKFGAVASKSAVAKK